MDATTSAITYTCPTCNRTCESKTGLFSHQKTHQYQTEGDIIIGFDGQP